MRVDHDQGDLKTEPKVGVINSHKKVLKLTELPTKHTLLLLLPSYAMSK